MGAHVALLRAEIREIVDEVKVVAAIGGTIAGLALLALNLLLIGTLLFLGEWLFGSLGWGVVDGVFLLAGVITALALILFMAPAGIIAGALAGAAVIGGLLAAVFALNLPRRLAEGGAAQLRATTSTLDPGWAPVVVGIVVGALVLGLLGLFAGLRSGQGAGSLATLVGGALLGAIVGSFLGGMTFSVQGGIALGIAIGLVCWPILQLGLAARAGVDPGKRFRRLYPHETIDTAQETRAWLEAEWVKRRERLTQR